MNLASFIIAMVGPIAIRFMVALGFTAVTFTGVTLTMDALVIYAQTTWSSIPTTVLQLATLSGIPEFLGMIFGAAAARVLMWASFGASKYIFKTP